jgi:hypothetical protein
MRLKATRKMPGHGQFIAIYSHQDRIYAHTLYMGKCGKLKHLVDSDYEAIVVSPEFYSEAIFIKGKA